MQEDNLLPNPIQPTYIDHNGILRFKENAIARFLLDNGGFDLNDLGRKDFSQTDREQFAQLIGYSVSGFSTLSYASTQTVEAIDWIVADPTISSDRARILHLEYQLNQITDLVRNLTVATFHLCEEDLVNDDILLIDREVQIPDLVTPKETTIELIYTDAIECGIWQQGRNYNLGDVVNFHDRIYAWKHKKPGNSQPALRQSSSDWASVGVAGNQGACAVEGVNSPIAPSVEQQQYFISKHSEWQSGAVYGRGNFIRYHDCSYTWNHFYDGNSVPIVGQSSDDWELISTKCSPDWEIEGRIGSQGLPGEIGEPAIPAPEQLNIYLVCRCDPGAGDWDEPEAIVVIAKNEVEAQQFAHRYDNHCSNLDSRFPVTVKHLGVARYELEAGSIATVVQGCYRRSLK